jgi:hypothetical protein
MMTKKNWALGLVSAAAAIVLVPLLMRPATPTFAQEKVAPP